MRGTELKEAIGNVMTISAFPENSHATGASANDFYGVNATADISAETTLTKEGPSNPSPV